MFRGTIMPLGTSGNLVSRLWTRSYWDDPSSKIWVWANTYRYLFSGMNIHLPAILGFTRYQGFDPSPYVTWSLAICWLNHHLCCSVVACFLSIGSLCWLSEPRQVTKQLQMGPGTEGECYCWGTSLHWVNRWLSERWWKWCSMSWKTINGV